MIDALAPAWRKGWAARLVSGGMTAAILLGALLATLFVFRLPLVESVRLIIEGAMGDKFAWSRTVVKATPLTMTGLGMVVAWRAGIYNIGGEGQFIVGGLCGAWFASTVAASIHGVAADGVLATILICSAAGGALWAGIAGWLFVKRGVAAVISTILLNFVALQVLSWAVSGPLQERKHQVPLTEQLPDALMLPKLDRQMDAHGGVLLAILASFAVFLFLFRTRRGYLLRLVGDSPAVARANRIAVGENQMVAMLISGALCGLAGGIELTGMSGQLGLGFSQQWGFVGIPVALLAGLHPLNVIVSALYFGALFAGSENLARFTDSGTTLIYVIQAIAVLAFVAMRSRKRSEAGTGEGE